MKKETGIDRKKLAVIVLVAVLLSLLFLALKSCGGGKGTEGGAEPAGDNPTKGGTGASVSKSNAETQSVKLMNIKAAIAGPECSFAITSDGTLWAWGSNNGGHLGDSAGQESAVPVKILQNVKSFAAGRDHALAVKDDGTLWVWGNNSFGQLGDGTTGISMSPRQVLSEVESAAAGEAFSVALKKDGTLWTWGKNNTGQLGKGDMEDSAKPVQVMQDVKGISAGNAHVLAVKSDGTLWAWGSGQSGQLAGKSNAKGKMPTGGSVPSQTEPVKLMDGVAEAAAGGMHSVVLDTQGNVWAWGDNSSGQLGDNWDGEWVSGMFGGRFMHTPVPKKVMTDAAAIAAGYANSAAVKKDGTLWVWGGNRDGQVGDGTTIAAGSPVQVLDSVASVSQGSSHIAVLKNDHTLWTWGSDRYGELGDGYSSRITEPVKILDEVLQASTYNGHSLAVKKDGTLVAFGENSIGQLGDGTWNNTSVPKPVMEGVSQAAAALAHSLCLKNDGTLWAWGSNSMGQLGNGNEEEVHSGFSVWEGGHPVLADSSGKKAEPNGKAVAYKPFEVMKDVKQAAASWATSYAVKEDGTLLAWGMNELGHMGDGTGSNTATPKSILGGIRQVIPLFSAIGKDGSLWSWGYNAADPNDRMPRKVMDQAVSAADCDRYTLAVKDDGSLWVWGSVNPGLLSRETTDTKMIEPLQIGENIKAVAGNQNNLFLVAKDGALWAADYNSIRAGTGNAEATGPLKHTKVRKVMEGVQEVICGLNHVLVLKTDGTLWGFGDNNLGQIGDGKRYFVPRQAFGN